MKKIIFLATIISFKIFFTVTNQGSFIDEYLHIKAALTNFDWAYMRGKYVSYAIILVINIFGKHLTALKFIPCIIGIINTLLLYKIAENIELEKNNIVILLIVYTLSPWIIFNHFYIRMYVFLELAFYTIILAIVLLDKYKYKLKILNKIILIGLIIVISLSYLFLTNDISKWIPLFVVIISILTNLFFGNWLNIYLSTKQIQHGITFISILSVLSLATKHNLVTILTNSALVHTSSDYKFLYYFFGLNIVITILFFFGIFYLLKEDTVSYKFIAVVGCILFILHSLAGYDYQLLRTIFYFHGIYYLLAIYGMANLNFVRKLNINIKIDQYVVIFLIVLTINLNYPNEFYIYPRIPNEIDYRDYQNAFKYINTIPKDDYYAILALPEGISKFYNYNPLGKGISPLNTTNQKLSKYVASFLNSNRSSVMLIDREGYSALKSAQLITDLENHSKIKEFYGYMRVFEKN